VTTASSFINSSSSDEGEAPNPAANKRSSAQTETPSLARRSQAPTVIEDSPAIIQSPFGNDTPTGTTQRNSSLLEGTKRHSGAPPPRVESPFSDVNEVK
jgi:hypothetical protein